MDCTDCKHFPGLRDGSYCAQGWKIHAWAGGRNGKGGACPWEDPHGVDVGGSMDCCSDFGFDTSPLVSDFRLDEDDAWRIYATPKKGWWQ